MRRTRLAGAAASAAVLCWVWAGEALGYGGYFVQQRYRWRNDDGSESGATWKAGVDTAITNVGRGQNIRLRVCVANTNANAGSTLAARLEYSTATGGPWTAVSGETNGLSPFEMAVTGWYSDGELTTAQLVGSGSFVAGRCVEHPSYQSVSVSYGAGQYSNFEYCFRATAKARGGTRYYFRVSNGGGALDSGYSVYPQLVMVSGEANEAPQIASALSAQASTQMPFSYVIRATGSEPIVYRASGLPAGLSFDGVDRISGQASAHGRYNVALVASNAWGVDNETLVLDVVGNLAPVASNQVASVVEGGEVAVALAWSDADNPSLYQHTFEIVGAPVRGTLESYYQRTGLTNYPNWYYYRAGAGVGSDRFTWRCRDLEDVSNIGTCSVTITANTAPVVADSSAGVSSGTRTGIGLSVTDPDVGQVRSFILVEGPRHGRVQMPSPTTGTYGTAYYTSSNDYVGVDTFRWRVSDGVATSGVATVTITVNAVPPAPYDHAAAVLKGSTTDIAPRYRGGGYSYTFHVSETDWKVGVSSVVVVSNMFRFTPKAGFVGKTWFKWYMKYNVTNSTSVVKCTVYVKEGGEYPNDWPQFRYDEWRDAATVTELPANLHLQWRRDLPTMKSIVRQYSHPHELVIDPVYMPVVLGRTLFVGFNRNDCVVAYDTRSGAERWRYYVGGPVRVAPVAFRLTNGQERVAIGSDDGFVYCLDAGSGELVWKLRAGPNGRKLFGDGRMISVWPVRGAPTYCKGRLIFGSGIWPVEGSFLWAVDAATGDVIWRNDRLAVYSASVSAKGLCEGLFMGLPGSIGLVGMVPMGYPAWARGYTDEFYLAIGPLEPGRFSFANGALKRVEVTLIGRPTTWMISADGHNGSDGGRWPSSYLMIAGARQYTAEDASDVVGSVGNMLVGDGRMFAVTGTGSIYCYGAEQVAPPVIYTNTITPLPSVNDLWTTNVAAILSQTGVNDKGLGMVWGLGSGRAMEELVKQSQLHVVGVDSNVGVVAEARGKFVGAGLYGERCSVLDIWPMALDVPPWQAWVLVVEDLGGAGWPVGGGGVGGVEFARRLFHVVRPYGGRAWLPTSAGQHAEFQGWVGAAGLTNATVLRSGGWTVLERTGALPGSIEYTAANGTITNSDALVRAPFAVAWYGNLPRMDTYEVAPDVTGGLIVEQGESCVIDVYTGTVRNQNRTHSGKKTVSVPQPGAVNPLYDRWSWTKFSGGANYGLISSGGAVSFNCGYWYDHGLNMGAVLVGHLGSTCVDVGGSYWGGQDGPGSMIPANGMYMWAMVNSGCTCAHAIKQAVCMYHRDDVEMWTSHAKMADRMDRTVEQRPVRKAGVNFGAPGSRMAENGTLWFDVPRHQPGTFPVIATLFEPAEPTPYYIHSGWMAGDSDRKWVGASGIKGAGRIEILMGYGLVALNADQAPVIDGNTGDSCWDGRWALPMQWRPDGGWYPTWYEKSRVQARYDSNNLYLLVECPWMLPEITTNNYIAVSLWDREQPTLPGTSDGRTVVFYSGNTGKWVGGAAPKGEWTNLWSAVYAEDANSRRCEMAIPWSTLEAAGLWTGNLIANVCWWTLSREYGVGMIEVQNLRHNGYLPLYLDRMKGLAGKERPYRVKVYFAETQGAAIGERVFNVKLQGKPVARNLDIVSSAGGPNRVLVKELENVMVADRLCIEMESVVGETVISGVELNGTWLDADYPCHPPVARMDMDRTSGETPLLVNFSARGSYDLDGQIAECRWDFGDGTLGRGSRASHVYTEPGEYTVTLLVVDSEGGAASVTGRVQVASGAPAAFISRIRAAGLGGDYTNLSSWAEAMKGDLTSRTWEFAVSNVGTYTNTDVGRAVTFTGGGTGKLLGLDTNAMVARIYGCEGPREAGVVTIAGGRTFTVSDTGVLKRSLLFRVGDLGTYSASEDDGRGVVFTGGGTGVLKHVNADGLVYAAECRGAIQAGRVQCASGHEFWVSDAGSELYLVVAEGYNDWPVTGLTDTVRFNGWITDQDHTVMIRPAPGQGHRGVMKDGAGRYNGFTLRGASSHPYPIIVDEIGNIRLSGVIVRTDLELGRGASVSRVISDGGYRFRVGADSTVANCMATGAYGFSPVPNTGVLNTMFINCTAVNCYFANSYGVSRVWFVNCLAKPLSGQSGFYIRSDTPSTWLVSCASSDATADDNDAVEDECGGNAVNRVFTFVNEAQKDYRLVEADTGARGKATSGFGADIEGQVRSAPYDIGADAAPYSGDFDGDGVRDEMDDDDDNDGMPDWWEVGNGLNPWNGGDGGVDADRDGRSNLEEYISGTDPWDGGSRLGVGRIMWRGVGIGLEFEAIGGRIYGVEYRDDLLGGLGWRELTNGVMGSGLMEVVDPSAGVRRYYRLKARLP